MALDGEPKDGDYVRYIERLVNRGMPSPGQVIAQDAAAKAKGYAPPLSPGEVGRPGGYQGGRQTTQGNGGTAAKDARRPDAAAGAKPVNGNGNAQANAARTGTGAAQPPSLAARSAQRKIASLIFLVGLLIAWHAARLIAGAFHDGNVDVSAAMPGAFLMVFALMVFAMSRNIRRNADRQAEGKLPPLTTVSGGKPGQGAGRNK
ncbi:hypothetical protein [Achromobacter aloeverae]